MRPIILSTFCSAGLLLAGCPSAEINCDEPLPTYENFGAEFIDTYCINCHTSELNGGGGGGYNFDTQEEFERYFAEIGDAVANTEPSVETIPMPPVSAMQVLREDRDKLEGWVVCGEE